MNELGHEEKKNTTKMDIVLMHGSFVEIHMY